MEMIERKCVAMEKPLPAEDPMDAEELVDPTFRHDHKVPPRPSPPARSFSTAATMH